MEKIWFFICLIVIMSINLNTMVSSFKKDADKMSWKTNLVGTVFGMGFAMVLQMPLFYWSYMWLWESGG